MKERTLGIIKPDGVANELVGEVIKRIETEGLKILGMYMAWLSKAEAEGFYAIHTGKDFFDALVEFTCSGPAVVMVLEGENAVTKWRGMMGATNSAEAEPGTIRGDLGNKKIIRENVVHGSDSEETAEEEINYFFKGYKK